MRFVLGNGASYQPIIYLSGEHGEECWTVGIADPRIPGVDLRVFELEGQAITTSSVTGRHWPSNRQLAHHLLAPRTATLPASPPIAATVVADCTGQAEMLAKGVLGMRSREGLQLLEKHDASGLLVLGSGETLMTHDIEQLVR